MTIFRLLDLAGQLCVVCRRLGKPFRGGARSIQERNYLLNNCSSWLDPLVLSGDHIVRAPRPTPQRRSPKPRIVEALRACRASLPGPPWPPVAPASFAEELLAQFRFACYRSMDSVWRKQLKQPGERSDRPHTARKKLTELAEGLLAFGPRVPVIREFFEPASGRGPFLAPLIGDAYRSGAYTRSQLRPLEDLPLAKRSGTGVRAPTLGDLLDEIDRVVGPDAHRDRTDSLRDLAFKKLKQADVFEAMRGLTDDFPANDDAARKAFQRLQQTLRERAEPKIDELREARRTFERDGGDPYGLR